MILPGELGEPHTVYLISTAYFCKKFCLWNPSVPQMWATSVPHGDRDATVAPCQSNSGVFLQHNTIPFQHWLHHGIRLPFNNFILFGHLTKVFILFRLKKRTCMKKCTKNVRRLILSIFFFTSDICMQ